MVHGEHYLTELLPGKWQRALGVPPSAMAGVRELPLDPATAQVFADVVHPILEQRCVACHGEAKSQGDLRMDSWEAMLLGGKHGALFKPGDVAGSRMIQRMLLPLDHEERMPPKTKPQLSDEELMLIEWWVGSGAPRIGTVAQAAPPPEVADILAERMGAGREEAPRGREEAARLATRAPAELPALRVSSRNVSQTGTISASGHQKGFDFVSFQFQRVRSMAWGPIWTTAPRMTMPCPSTLRARPPAATRMAVSRALERPPPRWSRMPYLAS